MVKVLITKPGLDGHDRGAKVVARAFEEAGAEVIDGVKKKGIDDVVYVLGGIIPQQDVPSLLEMGVSGVFGPGTPLEEVTDFAFEQVAVKKAEKLVDNMGADIGTRLSNV